MINSLLKKDVLKREMVSFSSGCHMITIKITNIKMPIPYSTFEYMYKCMLSYTVHLWQ